MTITFVGARDFEEQIGSQVAGGNPPDIAIFPQPGNLRDYAASEDAFPIPDDVLATAQENWSESWLAFWQTEDGTQYGVPVKSDLKSLVWYSPAAFEEKGYTVPETFDDFVALTEEMIANGDTPLCVGIESGPATGWPFTDWTEELILRNEGIDYYNQWVAHEVPFNDPPVVEAMQQIADLWATEGMVYAAGGSISATPFGDNAQALVDGNCMMHRQANFFAAFFPEGTEYGDGPGAIDTFYFPSTSGESPILVAGTSAAAFRDAPEVWAVMNYYASSDYANNRQVAQLERLGGEPGGETGLRLPVGGDRRRPGELQHAGAGLPRGAGHWRAGRLRRVRPDARRGRFRHVLAGGHGPRQRRDGRRKAAADAIESSWPS